MLAVQREDTLLKVRDVTAENGRLKHEVRLQILLSPSFLSISHEVYSSVQHINNLEAQPQNLIEQVNCMKLLSA